MAPGLAVGDAVIARRSFLAGILGAMAAPAIVRAESIMVVAPQKIVTRVDQFGEWGLIDGEIGLIDGFRIATPSFAGYISPTTAAWCAREMLDKARPMICDHLFIERDLFTELRAPSKTLKFRRPNTRIK